MLTEKTLQAAHPRPGRKYRKLADQGGLHLFCTTTGTTSWRYDYRLNGRRLTLCLGLYPQVTLDQAREHHARARALVAAGRRPKLGRSVTPTRTARAQVEFAS